MRSVIAAHELPWSLSQLGARAEYRFTPQPPVNGTQSHDAHDAELDDYLHIALANRGVLMTPFHNMALMSPATSVADVATHLWAFEAGGRGAGRLTAPPPARCGAAVPAGPRRP